MQTNKDYEQLYYDQVYENKKLKLKNKELEEQIEVYSSFLSKNTNKQLINAIINYFNKKRVN